LQEEVKKYEAILWKMQDYDADLARERTAVAYQEKEKMRLQVRHQLNMFLNTEHCV